MDQRARSLVYGVDFGAVEGEINATLRQSCERILADATARDRYSAMFDRTAEEAFYGEDGPVKGQGEQPTWAPNPAYMTSLEEMWDDCDPILANQGIGLGEPLRSAFHSSHEYRDSADVHRRVFVGHLVSTTSGVPLTLFTLSVPHSHAEFDYSEPPAIHISKPLGNVVR